LGRSASTNGQADGFNSAFLITPTQLNEKHSNSLVDGPSSDKNVRIAAFSADSADSS